MTKKLLVLCLFIVIPVNLAYAVESNTKKSTPSDQSMFKKGAAKESQTPVPPRPFKDSITGLEMVYVKGGCYEMGDTSGMGGAEEKPLHKVCVDDFYIGKHEVTQGQWKTIIGSNPSNNSSCGVNCPVENVSWEDVQNFVDKLNSKNTVGGTASKYRLPTEAEWEYAARSGGKSETYSGGDILLDVAWYYYFNGEDNYRWGTQPVGAKLPNGLGVFDMTGNVWEWTNDWFGNDYYSKSPEKNPIGPGSGDRRVLRGGSWRNGAYDLRTSYRNYLTPNYRSDSIGFRLLKMI